MLDGRAPRWLNLLERRFRWLEVPNIGILFVTLQALGFLMVTVSPVWMTRLALIPELVFQGEVWRLITFLALPVSLNLIWAFIGFWFLYFLLNLLESEWGSFKTTFYTLVSILVTIGFSLAFDYPVTQVTHFQSTLFLAAASLYPEVELQLFFLIPVKMKWLAWFSFAFLVLEMIRGTWMDRFFLLSIYSNYLVFFGPVYLSMIKQRMRRREFKRKMRS
jgi:hypothetical protein